MGLGPSVGHGTAGQAERARLPRFVAEFNDGCADLQRFRLVDIATRTLCDTESMRAIAPTLSVPGSPPGMSHANTGIV